MAFGTKLGHGATVLLLVTPHFSEKVTASDFTKEVLSRLFSGPFPGTDVPLNLQVVTAVVDRLPKPQYHSQARNENGVAQRQSPIIRSEGDGFEGVAYAFVQKLSSKQLPSSASSGRHGGVGTENPARTLDLIIQQEVPAAENSSDKPPTVMAELPNSPVTQCKTVAFEIPLANTLFLTGEAQTMTRSEWRIKAESSNPEFIRADQIERATAEINVELSGYKGPGRQIISVSAGLVPLTLPQRVHTAMGNVIRELAHPDDPSQTFPASQQLEKSVNAYFEALGTQPRAVSAWALILPEDQYQFWKSTNHNWALTEHPMDADVTVSEQADLENFWMSKQSTRQERILAVVTAGGRLVKVLSGGGGWGKRAGLLSLDYETSYSKSPEMLADIVSEVPSFLSSPEAAKPGELVQFFLATGEVHGHFESSPLRCSSLPSLEFGTVPSTLDTVPLQSAAVDEGQPAELHVYADFFGALSEKGIALTQVNDNGKRCSTKINVPNSRVTWSILPEPEQGLERSNPPSLNDSHQKRSNSTFARVQSSNKQLVRYYRYSTSAEPESQTRNKSAQHNAPLSSSKSPDHEIEKLVTYHYSGPPLVRMSHPLADNLRIMTSLSLHEWDKQDQSESPKKKGAKINDNLKWPSRTSTLIPDTALQADTSTSDNAASLRSIRYTQNPERSRASVKERRLLKTRALYEYLPQVARARQRQRRNALRSAPNYSVESGGLDLLERTSDAGLKINRTMAKPRHLFRRVNSTGQKMRTRRVQSTAKSEKKKDTGPASEKLVEAVSRLLQDF